jgi:Sec-independent protein translocase protein TatA
MIGPLEIAIIAVIILVIFGYKLAPHLPGLGRRAGEGARDLKETVSEKAPDAKSLGKKAGEGLREAREFRDVLTGKEIAEPPPRQSAPVRPVGEPDSEGAQPEPQQPKAD